MTELTTSSTTPDTPTAELRPERRFTWIWLITLAAIAFAVWLAFGAYAERGTLVSVQFPEGHGIRVGDDVRSRGIVIGTVHDVGLEPETEGIVATLRLTEEPHRFTRAGTRFWIVRPEVGWSGVRGTETILGPNYIASLPGVESERTQRAFVGAPLAPVVESADPDDLEIVLQADRRGSLARGTAVTFRQVRIGTVRSVGLASDGSMVEARVHIEHAYRSLVRQGTRFWDAGGMRADLRLTGIEVDIDSIEQLVSGGVALATPPADSAGVAVHTGHRFDLHRKANEAWLEWAASAPVGNALLPEGLTPPVPYRATLRWREGRVFRSREARSGWLLFTEGGLLGAADLLKQPSDARKDATFLEVAGQRIAITSEPEQRYAGLAMIEITADDGNPLRTPWPRARVRRPEVPEDCLAVGDPGAQPLPLAPSRLELDGHRWRVDGALGIAAWWHGAPVVARQDGALIGFLLVDGDGNAVVAVVPEFAL